MIEPRTAIIKASIEKAAAEIRNGVPGIPDQESEAEGDDLDDQRRIAELKSLTQDIDERKRYALSFFVLTCAWLFVMIAIVSLQGFAIGRFHVSDSIVLALISSTTVTVLGILAVVAHYLFPRR